MDGLPIKAIRRRTTSPLEVMLNVCGDCRVPTEFLYTASIEYSRKNGVAVASRVSAPASSVGENCE